MDLAAIAHPELRELVAAATRNDTSHAATRKTIAALSAATRSDTPWGTASEVATQLLNTLAGGVSSGEWVVALRCLNVMHTVVADGGPAALAAALVLEPRPGEPLSSEVATQLLNTLAGGVSSSEWAVALRCLNVMHAIVMDGGPAALAAALVLEPRPGEPLLAAAGYAGNACGRGTCQRPVVVFAACMLRFMLDVAALISPVAMRAVAETGLTVRHGLREESLGSPTVTPAAPPADHCAATTASDLLVRCAALQAYLNHLISAADLPLLAMDNSVSVAVLERVISDARLVYGCLWRHMEALLDTRFHAACPVAADDVSAWLGVIRTFRLVGRRLGSCFDHLAELTVGISQRLPEVVDLPPDCSARFQALVAAHTTPQVLTGPTVAGAANAACRDSPMSDDLERPASGDVAKRSGRSGDYAARPELSPITTAGGLMSPFRDRIPRGPQTQSDETSTSSDPAQSAVSSEGSSRVAARWDTDPDRYAVGEVIGRGAYGTVFKAFDTEHGRFVAVKVLKEEYDAGSQAMKELRREFEVLSNVRDDNVVSVFELDAEDGARSRIVMEWMPGGSLRSALKLTRRGLKESLVARYARQAVRGLAFLHARGIVHRDLKPANLLLSAAGVVKISDFGTARVTTALNAGRQYTQASSSARFTTSRRSASAAATHQRATCGPSGAPHSSSSAAPCRGTSTRRQWMPGGSLRSALKLTRHGLKESLVACYVQQAVRGLAFLHARGIVHRDLKPGNLLVSADGVVKITDFGTARVTTATDRGASVHTGVVVGTIPYLAPECFRGRYSPASDVWALGCTALELLSGAVPWHENAESTNAMALMYVIGNAQPPNHHPRLPPVAASASADDCDSESNASNAEPPPALPPVAASASADDCDSESNASNASADDGLADGPETISQTAADFLRCCFAHNSSDRPTACALLEHPFLSRRTAA
eukprot:CAMPEP_0174879220 /NCGR_PEP_ID=MMETSP1114-20130205/83149_1 /TAXON_ID=312471 /ORGANISM="Neobodo designis, Strain CCAP 1951/1" /LENGTH=942 /DNA_ID=CAMNT_0016114611 /DNA_START=299 /DNA_END=3130 /DNA_ORIENTATION=+